MGFDYQPTLSGQFVELRPLLASDYSPLYRIASDPLIWQQHPAPDRYQETVFRTFFDEALASGGALTAIDKSSQKVIGSSRYHAYSEIHSEVEIGWTFLARRHWGGRFNGDMKRLMLKHAFLFVEHVIFLVGTGNIRSQRAIEKIGALREGKRADASGNESYLYQVAREDYVASQPS